MLEYRDGYTLDYDVLPFDDKRYKEIIHCSIIEILCGLSNLLVIPVFYQK